MRGLIGSPPCKLYSAAGTGIGRLVIDVLATAIPRMLAGEDCREKVRAKIYPVALEAREAENEAREPTKRWTAERVEAAAQGDAFEAALVLEPARFIPACGPEWVALEQVPAVLPLWEVYAAELRSDGLQRVERETQRGRLRRTPDARARHPYRLPCPARRPPRADPLRRPQGRPTVGHAVGLDGRCARLGRDRRGRSPR